MSKAEQAAVAVMNKEIALAAAEQKELAALPAEIASSAWGAVEELNAHDIIVPKIYHMQAMSKFVAGGAARPGDFCDSLTGETLATKDQALEIIVFGLYKTLIVKKADARTGKFELDKVVRITPQNALEYGNRPFQEIINGSEYSNSLFYNFYCLVPGKIDELPYVLSLGSTKTKEAKKLASMLIKLQQRGKPGAAVVFEVRSEAEKNDDGSWFGVNIKQGRASTAAELKIAYEWYQKSKTQEIKVKDDGDEHGAGQEVVSEGDDLDF